MITFFFLIRKAIWKKILYPLLRVFCLDELHGHLWQYCWELVTKASIALHGDVQGAPPFTPHFKQGELLSVKGQVSQGKGIISLHPCALFVGSVILRWYQFYSLIIFLIKRKPFANE